MKKLTHQRLKEVLDYDHLTGVFTWRTKTNRRIVVGSIAGDVSAQNGRRVICIDREAILASRLAWFYVYEKWPEQQIDHKDGDPSHDWISNLRDVFPIGNSQNLTKAGKLSSTGLLGARKGRRGKWCSTIKVDKKAIYLGEFSTPEAAHDAYVSAKRKYHSTCTI